MCVRPMKWAVKPWHLGFLGVSLLYGIYLRRRSAIVVPDMETSRNVWDQIIGFMLDPYYICYFLLPVWLFSSASEIRMHFTSTALIRYGTFSAWLRGSAVRMFSQTSVLMGIWLASAFVSSTGLHAAWGWSTASRSDSMTNQVLSVVSNYGLGPMLVLAMQILLVGVTLLACYLVMAASYCIWQRQITVYTVAAGFFITGVVSFRRSITTAPFLDPANFLLLHRAFEAYEPLWLTYVPMIVLIIVCFVVVRRRERFTGGGSRVPVQALIYLGLCVVGLFYALVFQLQSRADTLTDVLYAAFFGVSQEGFEWNLYLYQAIVFLGFTYLFLLALDNELSGRIYYVALRHGTGQQWFLRFMRPFASRLGLLLVGLVSAAYLVSLLGRGQPTSAPPARIPGEHAQMLYQFFVNGVLQVGCYLLIVFVVAWLSGRPMAGLFALGGLLIAGMPIVNGALIFPAALNSLGYVDLGWEGLVRITMVLILYLAVLLISALLIVRNPKFFFSERA